MSLNEAWQRASTTDDGEWERVTTAREAYQFARMAEDPVAVMLRYMDFARAMLAYGDSVSLVLSAASQQATAEQGT